MASSRFSATAFPFLRVVIPADRPPLVALAERAGVELARSIAALPVEERARLEAMPLDGMLRDLNAYRPGEEHRQVGPGVRAIEAAVKAAGGEKWAATISRLLILAFLARLPEVTPRFAIPELAWPPVERDLEMLLGVVSADYGFSDWTDELFNKDIVAAQFRGPPHDGQTMHVRRFRPANSARHAPRTERLRLLHYLGKAYFEWGWYTGAHVWRGYKQHGRLSWTVRMERTAAIAAVNPEIRGQAAAGWFCDPKVAAISPGVAAKFIGIAGIGARSYRMRTGPDAVRDALFASKTRRDLYEAGKYVPTVYGSLLTRDDLLNWAYSAWERGDSAADFVPGYDPASAST